MIVRARTVVTMAGRPIDNGAVVMTGDRIIAAGTFDEIRKTHADEVLDLGEQIVLPGLINAHCHLDYTSLRGRIPAKESFTDWIRAINNEKEKLSAEDYLASIQTGLAQAARFGTTSIVNFEAFAELAVQARSRLRVWWLGELIDVRRGRLAEDLVGSTVKSLDQTDHWGLAPHAPFTASISLYQECQRVGLAHDGVLLSTHLAESEEEMEMFSDRSGPLFEFLKTIGRDMADCGGTTPLALFLDFLKPISPNQLSQWMVVHLNALSGSDLLSLAGLESKFHVVHCPRSHQYFGHRAFRYDYLRELGFTICLGTDSLASNDDLDLFEEMRLFSELHPQSSCREIVEMVTVNPARALRCENLVGQIRAGSYADLVAIADPRNRDVFESIITHDGPVDWLMVGGTVIES